MRALAVSLVLLAGCSVDVGAGAIDPVSIDAPLDVSTSPPLSLDAEYQFLSADDSQALAAQYGDQLGAVTAVDLAVDELAVVDGRGTPVPGWVLLISFDGVTLEKVGDRVRLPADAKRALLTAIAQGQEVDVDVQATVNWSLPTPPAMDAHVVVQPIFVVDELKAL